MNELISILMPVKNAEPFLVDAINSILQQSEKNWELIVVDDHSEDQSFSIIDDFSSSDNRIKLNTNPGHGIISALRTAYAHSAGQLIHRMDADDIMSENKLAALKNQLLKEGKGHVITSLVEYFSEEKVSKGYREYEHWLNSFCKQNNHWNHIYEECVIASPNWMVFRDDLDKAGAFNSNLYPEDYDLVFRFYKSNLNVKSISKILHYWREHPDRTSRNSILYQQRAFFELKTHYWLNLEYSGEYIIILGSGNKGKIISECLINKNIDHKWLKEKPKKMDDKFINQLKKENSKVIITVGDSIEKEKIKTLMDTLNLEPNSDYYFFR